MGCGNDGCRGGGGRGSGIDRSPATRKGKPEEREREGWQVEGAGVGADGGDGSDRQADGVGVAGGEPQAGAQRVTKRSKPKYRSSQERSP